MEYLERYRHKLFGKLRSDPAEIHVPGQLQGITWVGVGPEVAETG